MSKRKEKKKKSGKTDGWRTAKTSDRHELYELSVQNVEGEIDFVEKVWKEKLAEAKERWRVEKTDRDKQADELIEMISHSEAQKQQEEEDPECLYEDLEFAERHIPDEGAERCSFMVYVLFLALFMFHTVHGRPHAYHFAQYARDVGDVDDFMEIDDIIDYKDW